MKRRAGRTTLPSEAVAQVDDVEGGARVGLLDAAIGQMLDAVARGQVAVLAEHHAKAGVFRELERGGDHVIVGGARAAQQPRAHRQLQERHPGVAPPCDPHHRRRAELPQIVGIVVAVAEPAGNVELPLQIHLPALRVAPRQARIPQHGDLRLLQVMAVVEAVAQLDRGRRARGCAQAPGQRKQRRQGGAARPSPPPRGEGRKEGDATRMAVWSGFLVWSAHGKHAETMLRCGQASQGETGACSSQALPPYPICSTREGTLPRLKVAGTSALSAGYERGARPAATQDNRANMRGPVPAAWPARLRYVFRAGWKSPPAVCRDAQRVSGEPASARIPVRGQQTW
ncbi:protein of unknown function (plasmid) [Cupriavidus taiwanensis]|uniref:Uncharacterized protein n=1 Tax=Cupriavidus taiwanensis TaxID=164546 RepID=A0A375ILP8_9BURK|nr:protein of unknown function [Cupriavidus taiwanensis]